MKKSNKLKLTAGILTLSIGAGTFAVLKNEITDKDYIKNSDYTQYIESELDCDMQIMSYEDSIRCLKPSKDGNIYIYINDNIKNNVKNNITKIIDEVNTAFDYINDNYNLVVCDKETYTNQNKNNNTTISFQNLTFDSPYKYASTVTSNLFLNNIELLNKKIYIYNAKIYLNEEVFENLLTVSQLYTIKHELMHCFGFNDIYTGYKDETSIMNTNLSSLFSHLSPNDLKMLYCCYGNKHINSDGSFNQEKFDEFKIFLKNYTQTYYKYLVGQLEEKSGYIFQKINKEEISNQIFIKDDAKITLKDDTFEYISTNHSKQGNIILGENYIILPDIKLDQKDNNEYNDFLIILKINDKIECFNIDISLQKLKNNSIDTVLRLN